MSDDDPWLVRPTTIRLLWQVGLGALAVVVLADVVITPHGSFEIEEVTGFYSWYGFLTCLAMVIVAKLLGFFVKRDEDYYDR